MLILVNADAHGGRGIDRWEQVEPVLQDRGVTFTTRFTQSAEQAAQLLLDALADGEDCVIAAGGDGTVNGVLNALMDPTTDRPRAVDVTLGAIGLGSSNDFHKPLAGERAIEGVPVAVDPTSARRVDVGKAVLTLPGGETLTRYFLLNASLGVVAESNHYFNGDGRLLAFLKRRSTDAAIAYTSLVNLLAFKPCRLTIGLDGGPDIEYSVTNVGVLKKIQFAGDMSYDTDVVEDDGLLDVNVWLRQTRVGIVRTLVRLYQGRFKDLSCARCFRAQQVRLVPRRPAAFELDGEVFLVSKAEVSVLPKALRLCR